MYINDKGIYMYIIKVYTDNKGIHDPFRGG